MKDHSINRNVKFQNIMENKITPYFEKKMGLLYFGVANGVGLEIILFQNGVRSGIGDALNQNEIQLCRVKFYCSFKTSTSIKKEPQRFSVKQSLSYKAKAIIPPKRCHKPVKREL